LRKKLKGLYLIIDPNFNRSKLKSIVEEALIGGVDVVQLLESNMGQNEKIRLGINFRKLTEKYNIPLIINNDINFAKFLGSEGVHLDSYNLLPKEVRLNNGEDTIIGYTCGNNIERVIWAENNDADYISFCALFQSKHSSACDNIPLGLIKEAKKRSKISIFASGGIKFENANYPLEYGADGIAIISAILQSKNPRDATKHLKSIIDKVKKIKS
jgi:thiamine-phosphate pyrophosphorylase